MIIQKNLDLYQILAPVIFFFTIFRFFLSVSQNSSSSLVDLVRALFLIMLVTSSLALGPSTQLSFLFLAVWTMFWKSLWESGWSLLNLKAALLFMSCLCEW